MQREKLVERPRVSGQSAEGRYPRFRVTWIKVADGGDEAAKVGRDQIMQGLRGKAFSAGNKTGEGLRVLLEGVSNTPEMLSGDRRLGGRQECDKIYRITFPCL